VSARRTTIEAAPDDEGAPAPAPVPTWPRHVAVIMDGNGRWAARHGLPRAAGHRHGAEAVRRTVRAARELGLRVLTLFAFSAQNWTRPPAEVTSLMGLLAHFLREERDELRRTGVRLTTIGAVDRLPPGVRAQLAATARATADNDRLLLCLALSYGGREDLLAAARRLARAAKRGALDPDAIGEADLGAALSTRALPPVDLIIRTSGEERLSNFLLWEAAYAELYFTPCLWPDFDGADLKTAVEAFARRSRRFGGAGAAPPNGAPKAG
jgi:undecaprenyl diphosphate synthase